MVLLMDKEYDSLSKIDSRMRKDRLASDDITYHQVCATLNALDVIVDFGARRSLLTDRAFEARAQTEWNVSCKHRYVNQHQNAIVYHSRRHMW